MAHATPLLQSLSTPARSDRPMVHLQTPASSSGLGSVQRAQLLAYSRKHKACTVGRVPNLGIFSRAVLLLQNARKVSAAMHVSMASCTSASACQLGLWRQQQKSQIWGAAASCWTASHAAGRGHPESSRRLRRLAFLFVIFGELFLSRHARLHHDPTAARVWAALMPAMSWTQQHTDLPWRL